MRIVSVELHNIRSYTDAVFGFGPGRTLLCGDIGSGKSTVLLAIEFALFGVRKPGLTGDALLRRGARNGHVILKLEVGMGQVEIKRTLKKTGDDVRQDSGYIVCDNARTEGTALELKARILSILGYSPGLLQKHRDLIYRYTVYTPQEEMKALIFADPDIRLNTIRKVFGVDKYRCIRENTQVYIKALKERRQEYKGMTYDLEDKKSELKKTAEQRKERENVFSSEKQKAASLKGELDSQKEIVANLQGRLEALAQAERETERAKEKVSMLADELSRNQKEIRRLEGALPAKAEPVREQDFAGQIGAKEELVRQAEEELARARMERQSLAGLTQQSTQVVQRIEKLQKCPTCEQDVTEKHKLRINEREQKKLADIKHQEDELEKRILALAERAEGEAKKLKWLREEERKYLLCVSVLREYEEKKGRIARLAERNKAIREEVAGLNRKILEKKIPDAEKFRGEHRQAGQRLSEIQNKHQEALEKCAGFAAEIRHLAETARKLEQEIERKEDVKKKMLALLAWQNWLEQHFLPLAGVIERHVLSRLYHEFNTYFVDWFRMLIEDESMTAGLDSDFAPVVVQDGYDTDISTLSGGEKTSIGLAYRLALNKVINNSSEGLQTKDIIILDEPTDGFSDEQLDRVRDVLDSLGFSQAIIVSHEPKIESFADTVIRLAKTEHVSRQVE